MKMYCITIHNNHYEKIKTLGFTPVGLGENISSKKFKTDKEGENINNKNLYYGEYTFHYWIWKNEIQNLEDDWIGFSQYRKHWSKDNKNTYRNLNDLSKNLVKKIPDEYKKFESILGEPLFINNFKISKLVKKNFSKIIKNPNILYNKNKRNIKFHFDFMHGDGNLDKAISLLDYNDRNDFTEFVNTEVSFNPHNMFICKSKKILNEYYSAIFPWLKRCEKEFGFNLKGYGLKRIYGFLAERYMSFWFRKYTKYSTLPIIFQDISELD